ncbi:MAG: PEP/pyruvate-binding domain-containing protein, partial [Bacteroidia bacterium]
EIDSIADLLNDFVYYKVDQNQYIIRKASLEEVNAWFEELRPSEEQVPPLNLDYTSILPLSDISFSMADGFGAKCANLATMRTFGFPEGTIPDGFGVPFYFYQEFMKYNGFFSEARFILSNDDFKADRDVREDMLKAFRKKIKAAEMPQWMLDELAAMHALFPEGTSVRCRSSTNNEDLPGFSGAGLYDSKTQHPDEGHISKSIKQVFASLWNLEAFDERDFFRIDHFVASMGVLCHPNFKDEKANGVGVSTDPIYQTHNTFYLNSQLGEDLITNPDTSSIAEEILLDNSSASSDEYTVIRRSNLVPNTTLIMEERYLNEMREYLGVIHDEFAILYDAVGDDNFAMDIEYKITSEGQLSIKQARPWVSYRPAEPEPPLPIVNGVVCYPNPVVTNLSILCDECQIVKITVTSLAGRRMLSQALRVDNTAPRDIFVGDLNPGMYIISGFDVSGKRYFTQKFLKR